MLKELKNKKGFTLIELLAAIVILGVLMMVAIPAMTKYIENAKRDVFADTAKKYIASARYLLLSDSFTCPDTSGNRSCGLSDLVSTSSYLVIPIKWIEVENQTDKSPWGNKFTGNSAYVLVRNSGGEISPKYEYSFVGVDSGGNGIKLPIAENDIGRSAVAKNGSSIYTNFVTEQQFKGYLSSNGAYGGGLIFVNGVN